MDEHAQTGEDDQIRGDIRSLAEHDHAECKRRAEGVSLPVLVAQVGLDEVLAADLVQAHLRHAPVFRAHVE